ncbi:hypothetical protein FRC06_005342 [Ceratobasidium sp. 370]|nr:hypothetical protein FRC06_005342 [Ceratobasidium sp. 370]
MSSNLIPSMAAISKGNLDPIPLEFEEEWGIGPVFDWYNSLERPAGTLIQKIQIRKDVSGPVPHRFIVVCMVNEKVHRFDRRPKQVGNATDVIFNNAVDSEDSYTPNIGLTRETWISELEVELDLRGEVDLLAVISICHAISFDSFAGKYTLLKHNCFFFSWTILSIIARHHLPYRFPEVGSLVRLFDPHVDRLTEYMLNEAISFFPDMLAHTGLIFANEAQASMPGGVSFSGPLGVIIPDGLARSIVRHLVKLRLHFGLRNSLTKLIKTELVKVAETVYQAVTSSNTAHPLLDQYLWVEKVTNEFRGMMRAELLGIVWKFFLEVLSRGYAGATSDELQAQSPDSPELQYGFLGKSFAQCATVLGTSLQAGLVATREVAPDTVGKTHEEAFDQAWNAAREASLSAAKRAVRNTRETVNNPKLDAKWELLWTIWEDCWKEARPVIQLRAIQATDRIVEQVVAAGTSVVIGYMRETREKTIQANLPKKGRKWFKKQRQLALEMNNTDLQEYMRSIIKKNTLNADALGDVHESMERIWEGERNRLMLDSSSLSKTD